MVQRWVKTSIQGKDSPDNVYKRMREGWSPRSADSVKDELFPTINHGQWAVSIGIEGMLLCDMPVEHRASLKEWYNKRNLEQHDLIAGGVDAVGPNKGQPILQNRKTEVNSCRYVYVNYY